MIILNDFIDYLTYCKNIKKYLLFGFINGIISSWLLSYLPLLYSDIIEKIINNNFSNINYYLFSYVFYKIVGNIFGGIRGGIFTIFIDMINKNIKLKVLEVFSKKNLLYFKENNSGELANLIISDSEKMADIYAVNANIFIRTIAQFIITTKILLNKSYILYIICLILGGLEIFIQKLFYNYVYMKTIHIKDKIMIKQNELISDYTKNIETYRTLSLENDLKNKWKKYHEEYTIQKQKESIYYGINIIISQSISSLMIVILIYFGIYYKIDNKIIHTYIIYIGVIIEIINSFIGIYNSINNNKISISRIKNVLNNDEDNWGNYQVDLKKFNPDIFKDNIIFKNFSLYINNYSIVGIQGKSGKGCELFLYFFIFFYKNS